MTNRNSVIFEFFGKPKRSKKGCLADDITNESDLLVDGDEMNIYFKCLHCKCAIAATYNSNSNLHHHLKKSNHESVLEAFNLKKQESSSKPPAKRPKLSLFHTNQQTPDKSQTRLTNIASSPKYGKSSTQQANRYIFYVVLI
jgi:hypothetical protein